MKLVSFRVKNYKTIDDTGWIDVDDISCLVGVNESGKTNIITALLKLNPVDQSIKINPLQDFPRSRYSREKDLLSNVVFIEACFKLDESMQINIAQDGEDETIVAYSYLKVKKYYNDVCLYYAFDDIEDIDNDCKLKSIKLEEIDEKIPNFIYYASYANLDSELHLPTIISNESRYNELSEKTKNKIKTLRVLFDYINLKPQEIRDLGKEVNQGSVKSDAVIEQENEKKKEREILLDSAATSITKDFREWWKQGNYIFNFSVDGDYFRIWVSDSIRHDKIELENRSSGLQWFFSFFLIFMAEANKGHKNTIILLDEPGHTLHPMAQKDLSHFFNELSKQNQLIYTTHSPFLVDPMNITQTKVVYFEENGITNISSNLQINKAAAKKSIYPVNSAIGISVSDSMLIGCKPVIVEGVSDQIYMTQIKRILMRNSDFMSTEELIFMPVDGTKNIKPVVAIISGRDNILPFVIIDDDQIGKEKKKTLEKGLYVDEKNKIISISDYVIGDIVDAEIEDFIDKNEFIESFNKTFRLEEDFEVDEGNNDSIVKQIEDFCKKQEFVLPEGWKVMVAKKYVQRNKTPDEIVLSKWKELFDKIK